MIRKLKAYRSICREIAEKKVERKSRMLHSAVRGSDSEFPYIQHTISIDGLDVTEENDRLLERIRELEQQKKEVEDFVDQIEDSLTRRIFEYRYIQGDYKPDWRWIAAKVKGGNTPDGVRKIQERYLAKFKKQ